MDILAYFLAVIIGVSLGLIGGGGSILTVPVLVYLLHVDPLMATTYSLFIVGVTSLVGGAKAYTKRLIDFRAVALFGIPSILSIFIARHFLLPAIPHHLFNFGSLIITRDVLLMVVFALLMFAAAISMIRNELALGRADNSVQSRNPANGYDTETENRKSVSDSDRHDPDSADESDMSGPKIFREFNRSDRQIVHKSGRGDFPIAHEFDTNDPNLVLIIPGLLIGMVTGLLGAGGGFLIIPTLVLIIRMPMKIAVGTSLMIVAINSLFGFIFSISITPQKFNWPLMLLFTTLAISGIMIGSRLSDRIPADTLKKAFGWFIMIMGVYILIRELWL